METKAILLWSGGKDSCLALAALQQRGDVEVAGLLTTCTEMDLRVSAHGVPLRLIEQQGVSLDLPVHVVKVSAHSTNHEYEARMSQALLALRDKGIACIAAGDIFLEDLRDYRQAHWARLGMTPLFPLWQKETQSLMHEFIDAGFKAITVCVDRNAFAHPVGRASVEPGNTRNRLDGVSPYHHEPASFVGQLITHNFLSRLPAGVDPCGENGEYHSFVFAGPIFREPIALDIGNIVTRDRFSFCEIAPRS